MIDNVRAIYYFVRKGNYWIKDESFSDYELSTELFCNIDNKCFYDKNKEFCDVVENVADKMKKIAKKNLKRDFDTTIQLSMQDFEKELIKQYNFKETRIKKNRIIKEINAEKFSTLAFNIGLKASLLDIAISPHVMLRDNILSQPNMITKYKYVIDFKNIYCRDAIVNDVANDCQVLN